jgi:putative hydrolase of the HAD superfamily
MQTSFYVRLLQETLRKWRKAYVTAEPFESLNSMAQAKAFVFDFIGTLVNAGNYSMDASITKLHAALVNEGFVMGKQQFLGAYGRTHEKYRLVRYGELREVTNAIWVAETLQSLGFDVAVDDSRLKAALNVFFQDYVDSLELRPCVVKLLKKAAQSGKVGLISNFTYGPVVHASLRKLRIGGFFNVVVVSGDVGWRKPHRRIFEEALARLQVQASEVVYIGDSPAEDIKGANALGMRTVFVASQFCSPADYRASGIEANLVVGGLGEVCRDYERICMV